MKISPSIASANPLSIQDEIENLQNQYEDIHIDIEDGNFINNITFGMKTIRAIHSITSIPMSFHLMVMNPFKYLKEVVGLNASVIFAHVETLENPLEWIGEVHKIKCKAGLAFNPKTPIQPYLYALDRSDAVLIMTSEPDGEKQRYLTEMEGKIQDVRILGIKIWVDGGINFEIAEKLSDLGVDYCVLGRQIFYPKASN
jgi:ribulose-phosphate 3-epimerase